MLRIKYEDMVKEFNRVLLGRSFSREDAQAAAELFAQNSLDGVYSHGLNRFPRVVEYLDKGTIDPHARAQCVMAMGAAERWDGHRGFGPLNAKLAMNRACELAKLYGIGMVALGNNNHWMRGGTYGWQAADQGCIAICWSNTMPNMPAWGGVDRKIGNNPIVFAVPGSNGNHVVVDCAVSQFSYGKLEELRIKGAMLPVPGGYDENNQLTMDPSAVEKTGRVIPMGYWKGSGISILLDLIATVMTGGNSVRTIGTFEEEAGVSQMMIAMDPGKFQGAEATEQMVKDLVADLKTSIPAEEGRKVLYPGERVIATRKDNLKNGIPVVEEKWNAVLKM